MTVSRRSKKLSAELMSIVLERLVHRILDRTGLSMLGEGEWAQPSTEVVESGVGASCILGLIEEG